MALPTDPTAGLALERTPAVAPKPGVPPGVDARPAGAGMSDKELLDLHKTHKKESFDNRWVWERGWMRNIHYINGRQWITYNQRTNDWRDVRLAKWVPKPTNSKPSEGVQALRAMFSAVNIGVNVRPAPTTAAGDDPRNVAVAAICDDMGPLLHEEHEMDQVLNEADFWFVATGNVFLHTYLERDIKHGYSELPFEQCTGCQAIQSSDAIAQAGQTCPDCGSNQFMPATSPETGAPMTQRLPNGRGVTCALSPFELAFPNTYARFSDVPYVIRLRWRTKDYYESTPELKAQTAGIKWSKGPTEQSLQLFRSLPYTNEMGVAPFLNSQTGASEELGAPEYEEWIRPCATYPEGLVFRVVGDASPVVLHLEDAEAIPGPLPYVDAAGHPVFTFSHAAFEQRGGRIYGTSPLDAAISKFNALNQLDSMVQMIVQRMSNPLWLVPKGAEIEKFTGEPGLVVKWNPLTVGGNAKPERVDGLGPNETLFQLRKQHMEDIEAALGTFDMLKGQKPPGVDSFSGLQLMVERGQSRFASAFKSRGNLYKDWFKFALEIEREFGPEDRVQAVMSPANTWTQKLFKNTDLQGSFSVVVEDGSNTPKTTLGMRAAVEHLNTLGFLNPQDPDQKYKVFQLFGQSRLSPSLDIHMQAALRKQQAFEDWAQDPAAQQQSFMAAQQDMAQYQQQIAAMPPPPAPAPQVDPKTGQATPGAPPDPAQMQAMLPPPPPLTKQTPLAWKPWYSAPIHKQEFLKWANGDRMLEILAANPALEAILVAALQEMDAAIQMELMASQPPAPAKAGGGGMAMANSNGESGGSQNAGNHKAPPAKT